MFRRILYISLGVIFIYLGIVIIRTTGVLKYNENVSRMFFPNEHYVGKMVSARLTPEDKDSISYRVLLFLKMTIYRVDEFDNLLIADINHSIPKGNLGWSDDYEGLYTYLKKLPGHKKVIKKLNVSPNTFVLVLTESLNQKVVLGLKILGYILIILGIYLIYRLLIRRVVRI